jgi:hypothetical protein
MDDGRWKMGELGKSGKSGSPRVGKMKEQGVFVIQSEAKNLKELIPLNRFLRSRNDRTLGYALLR